MAPLRLIGAAVMLLCSVGATPPSIITADLEGAPIHAAAVGEHLCHDFDWPRIHCYRTAAALDAAVRSHVRSDAEASSRQVRASVDASVEESTLLATKYVKIFQYSAYAGNLAYLSRDYLNLDDIGWGDKISSYVVYNSASGEFYVNPGYGGAIDYFCCNQSLANLTSLFDNQISALNMN